MRKTKDEILQTTLETFSRYQGINATAPGTIARAFAEVIIEDIDGLYEEVYVMNERAQFSKSEGAYLDMNVELLGMERLEGETNDELKLRAHNQLAILARGNRIAIEDAIQRVPGISSYSFRRYGRGTGSFVCFVHAEPGYSEIQLVDSVQAAIDAVISDGIYAEVRTSKKAVVDMDWVLMFAEGTMESEKRDIRQRVLGLIQRHLTELKMGDTLYIEKLKSLVFEQSARIVDVGVLNMAVNGQERYVSNTMPESEQEFVAGKINIA